MVRKKPVKHTVKSHKRGNTTVKSFSRGSRKAKKSTQKRKVVGDHGHIPLWKQVFKGLGDTVKKHVLGVKGKPRWGAFENTKLRTGDIITVTDLEKGSVREIQVGNSIRAASLQPGSTYALGYTKFNAGYDLFQFGGISHPREKYGDSAIEKGLGYYENIKELKKIENVSSMKQIDELDKKYGGYGHHPYLVIRSYEGYNYGAYVFEGRWCVSSGASPLSFFEVREM